MTRTTRCLLVFGVLVPTQAWAIHVPDDVRTIQEAVDRASEWDTIFVDGSRYVTENPVTITKNIIIRPEKSAEGVDTGGDTGTVTSPSTVYYPNFLVIDASLRLSDGVIDTYGDMAGTNASGESFSGQAGVAILGSGELQVTDVSFYGGDGYAIYAVDATVWLTGGTISGFHTAHAVKAFSMVHDLYLTVSGTHFEDNRWNAIYVADYTSHYTYVLVDNATFVANSSYEYGGDVWLYHVDEATISNVTSSGSSAIEAGGSIGLTGTPASISSSSFTSSSAAYGGAIHVVGDGYQPYVQLTDVSFLNNVALGGGDDAAYGGDISVVNADMSLTRVDSTSSVAGYGGSIAALSSSVEVSGSTFIGGYAIAGGLYYGDGSLLGMMDTEVCETDGGLTLISSDAGTVYLNRAFFQSNAVETGPLVSVANADLYVYDNTLVNNTSEASFYGAYGGIAVVNTLFLASGTVTALAAVPFDAGYNLYSAAGDGDEYTTYGADVYADPVFDRSYVVGTCGSQAFLAPGSPGAGQGYADLDADIGAFPVAEGPDDTGIVETGVVDTDTAVDPHTGIVDDTAPAVDSDGDGTPDDVDCAPGDPAIYPGAYDDPLDDIDQDCDGDAADGLAHGGCGCDTPTPLGALVAVMSVLAVATRRRTAE